MLSQGLDNPGHLITGLMILYQVPLFNRQGFFSCAFTSIVTSTIAFSPINEDFYNKNYSFYAVACYCRFWPVDTLGSVWFRFFYFRHFFWNLQTLSSHFWNLFGRTLYHFVLLPLFTDSIVKSFYVSGYVSVFFFNCQFSV